MSDLWIGVIAALFGIIVLMFVLAWCAEKPWKKYQCPECGEGSDDSQEVFHHISQDHVIKVNEALNISNDRTDELHKIYINLVRAYKTRGSVLLAISDLQNISPSEKVFLGYILGRNVSMKETEGVVVCRNY